MTPKTKTQSQILAAVSCISLLTLAYLNITETPFGYFSFHLFAAFAFLSVFVPLIILEEFESRKEKAIEAIKEAVNSGKVTNRRALNVVLDRASKIYLLDRSTFKTF